MGQTCTHMNTVTYEKTLKFVSFNASEDATSVTPEDVYLLKANFKAATQHLMHIGQFCEEMLICHIPEATLVPKLNDDGITKRPELMQGVLLLKGIECFVNSASSRTNLQSKIAYLAIFHEQYGLTPLRMAQIIHVVEDMFVEKIMLYCEQRAAETECAWKRLFREVKGTFIAEGKKSERLSTTTDDDCESH